MIWVKIASLVMFLSVLLGAFGAHALRIYLTDAQMASYKTAVLYQFVHGLGLFVVAWLSTISQDPKISLAGIFMIIGIILFSGSLYLLAITGIKILGAVTPLGGASFLIAWILLFLVK